MIRDYLIAAEYDLSNLDDISYLVIYHEKFLYASPIFLEVILKWHVLMSLEIRNFVFEKKNWKKDLKQQNNETYLLSNFLSKIITRKLTK